MVPLGRLCSVDPSGAFVNGQRAETHRCLVRAPVTPEPDPGHIQYLDHGGVSLAYLDVGAGDPPLVLVHGMACDHTHLLPQLRHLSPHHRTIAVDLRGHGHSDKPRGAYTTEVFGDDLLFLFDRLGLDQPVLIGHSLGGSISLALAARHPDRVGALVLLDSGIRANEAKRDELKPFYDELGGPDHAERVRRFVIDRLFEPTDPQDVLDTVATTMAGTPAHVFLAMGEGVLAFDSRAAAQRCPIPSLLILAARPFVPPDVVESLPPNWQVGRVVGAGHFIQLVVPNQVNAMLDRFLTLLGEQPQRQ